MTSLKSINNTNLLIFYKNEEHLSRKNPKYPKYF